jgi:ribosome biogenesis GTPase
MSKRHLTHQQHRRIHAKTSQKNALEGLVITCVGKDSIIELINGEHIICKKRATVPAIVPGDIVQWESIESEQQNIRGIIINVNSRHNLLERPDKFNKIKPIASNITQMLIVFAKEPAVSWLLIDSYIVMARHLNIKPILIHNKIDLIDDSIQHQLSVIYQKLNITCIGLSKHQPDSYTKIKPVIENETSIVVGQSGVGKSSLIKILKPFDNILTQEISEKMGLGKHTTTHTKLYHIGSSGKLIDSPGIREFAVTHLSKEEIKFGFEEFIPFYKNCKFRNCTHYNEPHCGLQNAIAQGFIEESRVYSFHKLMGYI